MDGLKFFVADSANNRVLIWNTVPTANKQAADYVLGQVNFITNGANTGGATDVTFSNPTGVYSDQDVLYIADTSNHRIVIYTNNYSLPTISTLYQYLPDGTTLVPNGYIGANFGVISADIVTPGDTLSQVQLFVEVRSINNPFVSLGTNTQAQEADPVNAPRVTSGEGIYASTLSPNANYSTIPYTANIPIIGLPTGQYKWRAIAYNTNIYSPWKKLSLSIPNFSINTTPLVSAVTSTGSYINVSNQTSFPITCNGITDPDLGQTLAGSYSFDGGTNWYTLGTIASPVLNSVITANIDLTTVNPIGFSGEGTKNIVCRITDGFVTTSASTALTIVKDTVPPVFSTKTVFSGWNIVAPLSTFTYTD